MTIFDEIIKKPPTLRKLVTKKNEGKRSDKILHEWEKVKFYI